MKTESILQLAQSALPALYQGAGALLVSFIPSLCLALVLAEWGPQWLKQAGKRILYALAPLPLVALALGIFLVLPAAGNGQKPFMIHALPATVLIALALIPRMASHMVSALQAVPRETRRAGAALGAHPLVITGTLVIPGARWGIVRGLFAGFASVLAESSIVILIVQARFDFWPLLILAFGLSLLATGWVREGRP